MSDLRVYDTYRHNVFICWVLRKIFCFESEYKNLTVIQKRENFKKIIAMKIVNKPQMFCDQI